MFYVNSPKTWEPVCHPENFDLLVRCLEKVNQKYSPKWLFNGNKSPTKQIHSLFGSGGRTFGSVKLREKFDPRGQPSNPVVEGPMFRGFKKRGRETGGQLPCRERGKISHRTHGKFGKASTEQSAGGKMGDGLVPRMVYDTNPNFTHFYKGNPWKLPDIYGLFDPPKRWVPFTDIWERADHPKNKILGETTICTCYIGLKIFQPARSWFATKLSEST